MPELPARDFLLDATLSSGQTFRWILRNGWYYGCVGTAILRVRQEGGRLFYDSADSAFSAEDLTRYFALDVDLADILRQIDVDMQMHLAIERYRGVRILRQESWEVLASFICASFNNIKRIEGMIEGLCQAFGRPVALKGLRTFTFPSAAVLAGVPERRLRSLGLGYRAPYLKATARLVADGLLPFGHLRRVSYDTVKQALLQCDGVGDKVADCVALFGFEKYEAFPIDVWMERAMRYYFRHRRMTRKRLHDYARRHFGPYAGYAQQYLYHYIRHAHRPSLGSPGVEPDRWPERRLTDHTRPLAAIA
jgi:N-glycosylase/DNA lyase